MQFRRRVLQWLAVFLVLVYWGLGLPLTLLFVSHDPPQLYWVLIPYAWEIPVLGILLILWPVGRRLDAVADFLDADPPVTDRERLERIRNLAMNLPLQVAVVVVGASLVVYALASLQMRTLGDLPHREVVKNLVLGLPTGLLYGLLAYFLLTNLLAPLLERCHARLGPEAQMAPRVPLFWKTFACFMVVSILAVTVMGLLSYTSTQRLLEANLASSLDSRLNDFTHAVETGQPWTPLLEFQGQEMVGVLSRDRRIVYYRGPDGGQSLLLADADWVRGARGTYMLRSGEARLLAWQRLPGDSKVVAEVPFSLHAGTLARELRSILLAGGVTLGAALLLAIIFSRTLSRPVVALTAIATSVPREWPSEVETGHLDDEIGVLSRALQGMLSELRRGQDDLLEANQLLGQMVKDRTRAMQDLSTLLDLSQLLSSTMEVEPVLEELLSRVQGALGADGGRILLLERQGLVEQARVGMAGPQSIRPIPIGLEPIAEALRTGRPFTLRLDRGEGPPLLSSGGELKSVVGVPMVGRDQPVGMLAVYFRDVRALSPEALALLRSIGGQAGVALSKARLFQEKSRVTELLRSVLRPQSDLGFPGLDVGYVYIPSRDLSGDYFDLIPLGDRKVGITIADVAGKGSEAAIEALRIKHTIQTYATAGYPPGTMLQLLNELLHRMAAEMPRMVTLFYGELDLDSGTLRFASAGHEPAVLWTPRERGPRLLVSGGIVLGAIPDAEYEEAVVHLERGAWITLYTDGITEARSPAGELFGPDRLFELLVRSDARTARALAEEVNQAVGEFSGGELSDDLSLLILRCVDLPARAEAAARAGENR